MIQSEHIQELVESVWSTMLEMQLRVVDTISLDLPGCLVTACVHITGSWEGSVLIQCSEGSAQGLAGRMFGMGTEEVSAEEVRDAMGELANMVGGNFKGLLSGDCYISLPTVVTGPDYSVTVKGAQVLHTVGFDGEGELILVEVYQRG